MVVYHNDSSSSGVNPLETTLTQSNVNVNSFSKLYATPVDGLVQAQPLYLPGVNVVSGPSAGTHDLIFVATQHDSLYAIDAESGAVVWQTSFLDSGLAGATITTVPSTDVLSTDVTPEIGICSTPVIDSSTNLLYVTAKTKQVVNGGTPNYIYTLYQIDITNGNATPDANIVKSTVIGDTMWDGISYTYRTNSDPTAVQDPFTAGATGDGAITVNGQSRVYFNTLRQMNRSGLMIYNGVVYIAFGSHGDNPPYHGWLLGYDKSTLTPVAAWNTTPNGAWAGIWEAGSAPVVDSSGNIYVVTGNGSFDGNNGYSGSGSSAPGPVTGLDSNNFPAQGDFGDSVVKLAPDPTTSAGNQGLNGWGLKVLDYFSPYNNQILSTDDSDLGSGGCVLLPDSAGSSTYPHLMVAAGKQGNLYLINRDSLGKYSTTDNVVQSQILTGSFGTPAFFNGNLFWSLFGSDATSFSIANAVMATAPIITPDSFAWPGATPSVSANGAANGVVWLVERGTNELRAYSADNFGVELYTSAQASNNRDALGTITKFSAPTVADGRVMVGTSHSLVVYGLTPPSAPPPPVAPTVTTGLASSITGTSVTLSGTANPEGTDTSASFQYGTTTAYGNTTTGQDEGPGTLNVNFTQSVGGLTPSTTYHYRAVAASTGGVVYGADKTFKTIAQQTVGTTPQAYLSASGVEIGYTVATDGIPTTVYIQYGTDTTYGSVTATIKIAASSAPAKLLALLSGLSPGTTYDYQIVTKSSAGTVVSANQTFTTLSFSTDLVAEVSTVTADVAGAGFSYASFGNPAINDSGNTAFRGVLKLAEGVTAATDAGIWADDANGDLQLIAQTGTGAAPGTTAPFTALNDPVYNNNSAVAFVGTLKVGSGLATTANDVGVWSNSGGNLSLVARKGAQAPGCPAGVTFSGFSQVALPDVNGVIMLATLNVNAALGVTAASDVGIWAVNGSGTLNLVARTGQLLSGKTVTALSFMSEAAPVTAQSRSFAQSTGTMTFLATFSDRTTGIFDATSGGAITVIAAAHSSAQGPVGATFASFGPPAINGNGNNAFRAILSSGSGVNAYNDEGIWTDDSAGSSQLVAEIGAGPAPGTTAPFAALSDPVFNDNNDLAFVGTLKVGAGLATTTTKSGVWSNESGSLALVAQTGMQAPGCAAGITFSGFSEIALPDSNGVVMLATLNLNTALGVSYATDAGIWATDSSGNLDLIVRTGDMLNGKTVTSLAFLPAVATVSGQSRSFSLDSGNLVYLATFSDHTTAIYSVVFP